MPHKSSKLIGYLFGFPVFMREGLDPREWSLCPIRRVISAHEHRPRDWKTMLSIDAVYTQEQLKAEYEKGRRAGRAEGTTTIANMQEEITVLERRVESQKGKIQTLERALVRSAEGREVR